MRARSLIVRGVVAFIPKLKCFSGIFTGNIVRVTDRSLRFWPRWSTGRAQKKRHGIVRGPNIAFSASHIVEHG